MTVIIGCYKSSLIDLQAHANPLAGYPLTEMTNFDGDTFTVKMVKPSITLPAIPTPGQIVLADLLVLSTDTACSIDQLAAYQDADHAIIATADPIYQGPINPALFDKISYTFPALTIHYLWDGSVPEIEVFMHAQTSPLSDPAYYHTKKFNIHLFFCNYILVPSSPNQTLSYAQYSPQ
jgi:hypothetical protein